MLTHDEIRALAFLIALALIGAGLAHIDARHPNVLTLTLGDSLALGGVATSSEAAPGEPPTGGPSLVEPAADSTAARARPTVDLAGRVDVNRAGAEELELLPGVGPRMAERILEDRRLHGRYRRTRDLTRVKGIGEKTLARLLPYIRTDSAADTTRRP